MLELFETGFCGKESGEKGIYREFVRGGHVNKGRVWGQVPL